MRSRLLLVLSVLGLVTVTLFAVPLAVALAQARTQEFALSRTADLERFVALAGPYVRGEQPGNLFGEIDTYSALYGEPVGVVSTRGAAAYPPGFGDRSDEVADAVARALRNQPDGLTTWLTPWGPDRVVLARATGTDAQITGAVVMVASTGATRAAIAGSWAVVAAGGIAALAALLGFAVGVSRWILRPLGRLSAGMRELVSVLPRSRRTHDDRLLPVAARSGPPELRELSHTFALMAGQIRRSSEAQRRLVSDTAHQLRNPLAALQMRIEALEGRVLPEAEPGYRRAVGEAERLGRILDDLLVLSRAEVPAHIGGPGQDGCRPAVVAAERVEIWQRSAEDAGVRLVGPSGGTDLVARFDGDDLAQVLDVLLDNACKYAGPGSEATVAVTRTTAGTDDDGVAAGGGAEGGGAEGGGAPAPGRDGPVVRVAVADTGRGVAGPDLGRVRERFYRGAAAAGSRGTGLGLSIVEAIVASGGGAFALRPTPGGGLTAVVDVPAGAAAEVGVPADRRPAGETAAGAP